MRKLWCKKDFVVANETYCTRGNWYRAIKHHNGTYSIRTNKGSWCVVSSGFGMCEHFIPMQKTTASA